MRLTGHVLLAACLITPSMTQAQSPATLTVRVQAEAGPASGALVTVGAQSATTPADGRVSVLVSTGVVSVVVTKAKAASRLSSSNASR